MPTSSRNVFGTRNGSISRCSENKKLFWFLPVLVIIGCMCSCISFKSIDFQALRPAKIKIGQGIEKVDIHCEFCGYNLSLNKMELADYREAKASVGFLESLKYNLEASPIFSNTRFYTISFDSLMLELKNIKLRKAEKGLVILLDSIHIADTIISIGKQYGEEYYTFGIVHKFGCRTYDKSNLQIIDNYLMEDTLFWPPQPNLWELENSLPSQHEAYDEMAQRAGTSYAHYLAPYWTDQSRLFFYGKKAFNNSYRLVQNNEPDNALQILEQELIKKPNHKKRWMALHNMAVVYEIKDDIDKAFSVADSAYKIKKSRYTKELMDELRIRKLDKAALDWQLN